ncbi:hypothetical protein MVEN_00107800 [Mycena venus]|uniref:Uncharacterized protein n=1 Tax=Mycena venus TaxID=2733690 RepID=A0A8H7DGN9_9AGAR|nr:hypothetical protein MVEN_00107800 [Mycena venus]
MSSPLRCSPPFHPDPGTTKDTVRAFDLVTSPAEAEKRGTYTSWASVQRVCENIPRGGATRFATRDECLLAWHSCCDAGEHDHPAPQIVRSVQAAAAFPSPELQTTSQIGRRLAQTGAGGGAGLTSPTHP